MVNKHLWHSCPDFRVLNLWLVVVRTQVLDGTLKQKKKEIEPK